MACFANFTLVDVSEGDVTPESGLVPHSCMIIEDGRIKQLGGDEVRRQWEGKGGVIVDLQGHFVAPGFLDLQTNGSFGVDYSGPSPSRSTFVSVAKKLCRQGVTGYCPTLVSLREDQYRSILPELVPEAEGGGDEWGEDAEKAAELGARNLGVHVEGPYFCRLKKGAHKEDNIRDPSGLTGFQELTGGVDGVAIVTMAPELPRGVDTIAEMTEKNMVVSMGHTSATLEDGRRAVQAGASLITHLFNAMNGLHHRKPGLLGLLTGGSEERRPYWSLICDGIHVCKEAVCIAYSAHPKGCVLVTDSMAAMGCEDGELDLGDVKVIVKNNKATVAGTDTLAGAVTMLDECLRIFMSFTGCSLPDAVRCVTVNPAKVLGRRGDLYVGGNADFVVLDKETHRVLKTYVGGGMTFEEELNKKLKHKHSDDN
ncbi:hypothetical protein TrRE_jg3421 [Triparma retinervis]|uniref:N-acetylglucosamine-6-phosphate deacetylase n=1 Tax=Triparma retinervis TaxID=2557542 RepID=A0A9W7FZC3_9STRA|nr:hypothetical protein TrRE_jg3421 [Triparma retinervis]